MKRILSSFTVFILLILLLMSHNSNIVNAAPKPTPKPPKKIKITPIPTPTDTTPPLITNVQINNIKANSVSISWSTNEPTTGEIEYGFTNTYGKKSIDPTSSLTHSATLTNLIANTAYHFKIISKDSSGNDSSSGDQAFNTLEAAWSAPKTIVPSILGNSMNAEMVWDGDGYGMVWGTYDSDNSGEVYFKRIDSTGENLTNPILIGAGGMPAISWDGQKYGIAWSSRPTSEQPAIYFTRIDKSGNEIGTDVKVNSLTCRGIFPDIQWNGTEYGVVWEGNACPGNAGMYFNTISADGILNMSEKLIQDSAFSNIFQAKITSNAGTFGIISRNTKSEMDQYITDIFYTPVYTQNLIGSSTNLTNNLSSPFLDQVHHPLIISNANDYGVVWKSIGTTNFVTISEQGELKSTIQGISSWSGNNDGIAWNSNKYGLVFPRNIGDDIRVYFAEYDAQGQLVGSIRRELTTTGVSISPQIIFNGVGYAALWKNGNTNAIEFSYQTE